MAVALGNGDGTFQAPVFGRGPHQLRQRRKPIRGRRGYESGRYPRYRRTAGGTVLFGDGKGGFLTRRDYLLRTPAKLRDHFGRMWMATGVLDILVGNGNSLFATALSAYPTFSVIFGAGGESIPSEHPSRFQPPKRPRRWRPISMGMANPISSSTILKAALSISPPATATEPSRSPINTPPTLPICRQSLLPPPISIAMASRISPLLPSFLTRANPLALSKSSSATEMARCARPYRCRYPHPTLWPWASPISTAMAFPILPQSRKAVFGCGSARRWHVLRAFHRNLFAGLSQFACPLRFQRLMANPISRSLIPAAPNPSPFCSATATGHFRRPRPSRFSTTAPSTPNAARAIFAHTSPISMAMASRTWS